MKKLILVSLLWPVSLVAQSPFDGTWVVKLESVHFPKKPEVYLLQNGSYSCASCVPRLELKADGEDHPVAGSPYFSMAKVRVIDDKTIEITEKQNDKTVYMETDMVSPDGNTLVQKIMDAAAPEGEPMTANETLQRVGAGPAGSSPISGSWQAQKMTSATGMTVTYHGTADGLEASNRHGEGYTAKFDGRDYPIQGDPAHGTVSLRRLNANTIEETDKQEGAVHYKVRMTVLKDGKSMVVRETDRERGTQMSYMMEKEAH